MKINSQGKAINALGTSLPDLSDEEKEKDWKSLLEFTRKGPI